MQSPAVPDLKLATVQASVVLVLSYSDPVRPARSRRDRQRHGARWVRANVARADRQVLTHW